MSEVDNSNLILEDNNGQFAEEQSAAVVDEVVQKTPAKVKSARKSNSDIIPEVLTSERSKRERKQVAVYNVSAETPSKAVVQIVHGSGITLGEYEFFTSALEKLRGDDEVIKGLHSIMYNNPGKKLETKKHLRLFSGFSSGTSTQEKKDKLIAAKKRWTVSILKEALGLFGLEKSGSREELIERLIDYLKEPKAIKSGKSAGKKRRSTGSKGKKQTKKQKKSGNRAPSAFILFSNTIRADIKAKHPEASFVEVGRLIGQAWQDLKEEDKAFWNSKAAELKGGSSGHASASEDGSDAEESNEDDEDNEDQEESGSESENEEADSDDSSLKDRAAASDDE